MPSSQNSSNSPDGRETMTLDWYRGRIEIQCAEARKTMKECIVLDAVLGIIALLLFLFGESQIATWVFVLILAILTNAAIGTIRVLEQAKRMTAFQVEEKMMWGFISTWFGQRNLLVRQPCYVISSDKIILDVLATDSFRLEGELADLLETEKARQEETEGITLQEL